MDELLPFLWQAPDTIRLKAPAIDDPVVGGAGFELVASHPRIGRTDTAGLRATHIPADFDNFVVLLLEDTIEVEIDTKLGTDSNGVNASNNGISPVAIPATTDFDATSLEGVTATFGPGEPGEVHHSSPMGHFENVDRDGEIHAVFHFRIRRIGFDCDATVLILESQLRHQTPIAGTDSVSVKGNCA